MKGMTVKLKVQMVFFPELNWYLIFPLILYPLIISDDNHLRLLDLILG